MSTLHGLCNLSCGLLMRPGAAQSVQASNTEQKRAFLQQASMCRSVSVAPCRPSTYYAEIGSASAITCPVSTVTTADWASPSGWPAMPLLRAQANEGVVLEVSCGDSAAVDVQLVAVSAASGATVALDCRHAIDAAARKRVQLCHLSSAVVDEIVVVAVPAGGGDGEDVPSAEALRARLAAAADVASSSSSSLLLRVSSGGASAGASTVLIDDASPLTHVPAGSAGALAVLLRDAAGNAACGRGRHTAANVASPTFGSSQQQQQSHRIVDVLLVPVSWPGDAATAIAAAVPASSASGAGHNCSVDSLLPLRAKVDASAVHRGRCGALPVEFLPQCPGWWSVLATVADDEGRRAGSIPVTALPAEDPLLQVAFTAGRDSAAAAFGAFWPAHVYVSGASSASPHPSAAQAECPRVSATAHPLVDANVNRSVPVEFVAAAANGLSAFSFFS